MSRIEVEAMIRNYKSIEKMVSDLTNKMTAIEEQIKKEMVERNTEELRCGSFVVRFTSVLSSRFNTRLFKQVIGADVYKMFCKEVFNKRFQIC